MASRGKRLCVLICVVVGLGACTRESYTNFETIPTRALALSPDGRTLFVTNTPDCRLEIFAVTAQGLVPRGSVEVGLDPVAVAARTNSEVWVVNHLSDSVSIVDVGAATPHVVRTLLVGDEPRDIVFAGANRSRAFITAAARGQNVPGADIPQELLTERLGRADVWVFNALDPSGGVGGRPLTILRLFGDKPGSLTVSPDGRRVYAGIFNSGNETTVISQEAMCGPTENAAPCTKPGIVGTLPGGVPGPNVNQVDGAPGPLIGTIVKFERATGAWRDVLGRDWRSAVRFTLPDRDVFEIDALATPPVQVRSFDHVGTINMGMEAHPTNGNVYVANTDAQNLNRFLSLPSARAFPNPTGAKGAALTADPATGKTLNGHLYESRITVLGADGSVRPRHLNKHIDYEVVPTREPGVKERSVGSPHSLTFSPDGQTVYVAAMGSNQIVRFATAEIDANTFVPSAATHIPLSGFGPTNMVVDAANNRGYVYTRLDDSLITLDLRTNTEIARTALFSPEPLNVFFGRRFFYDSVIGSSNGEASCAVCHPGGDKDDLAWDLGTPFFGQSADPNPFEFNPGIPRTFSPLKGPMTVLTIRGIGGSLFWRGDRTNSMNPRDTLANFMTLGAVFPALMGRDGFLADSDFAFLSLWALSVAPPPNPIRRLDNALTPRQQAGSDLFFGPISDVVRTCDGCHTTNPALGQFGTDGDSVDDGQLQNFKIPHLRNQYDKVGMFGRTDGVSGSAQLGPQVRGTGTRHNGSNGGDVDFLDRDAFQINRVPLSLAQREALSDFMHAFPSNVAPIVGQQVTLRSDSGPEVMERVRLMMARAAAPFVLFGRPDAKECELIAKGVVNGTVRGFLYRPASDDFLLDDVNSETIASRFVLDLAKTPGQEMTFTCIYPAGGTRLGLDRDDDKVLDFNDR